MIPRGSARTVLSLQVIKTARLYVTNFRNVVCPIYPLVQCVQETFLLAALIKTIDKVIVTELKEYSSDILFVPRISLTFRKDNSLFTRKVMGSDLPTHACNVGHDVKCVAGALLKCH